MVLNFIPDDHDEPRGTDEIGEIPLFCDGAVTLVIDFKGNLEHRVSGAATRIRSSEAMPEDATQRTIHTLLRIVLQTVLYTNVLPVPPGPLRKKT